MAPLLLQLAVLGAALAAVALILVRRGVGDRRGPGLTALRETRAPGILSSALPALGRVPCTILPLSLDPRISSARISHPLSSVLYVYFRALYPCVPRA